MENKIIMAEDNFFDISFQCEGKQYSGWVRPSEKSTKEGSPASYHVVLNEVFFGNLSFKDGKWLVDDQRPDAIVQCAGKSIEKSLQGSGH